MALIKREGEARTGTAAGVSRVRAMGFGMAFVAGAAARQVSEAVLSEVFMRIAF
jgi:hypothetical protein